MSDSGWAERRDMHPRDILLRSKGFRIHLRPNDAPTLWIRFGKVWTFEEAMALVEAERLVVESQRREKKEEEISGEKEEPRPTFKKRKGGL